MDATALYLHFPVVALALSHVHICNIMIDMHGLFITGIHVPEIESEEIWLLLK